MAPTGQRWRADPARARPGRLPGLPAPLPGAIPGPAHLVRRRAERTPLAPWPGRGPAARRRLQPGPRLRALGAVGYGLHRDLGSASANHVPAQVLRDYLAEAAALISGFDTFEVLAHIDYPVRYWPRDARPFDPREFEDKYRHVLRTLASAGKILEVNTRVPLHPQILTWWRQEGGQAITFASDAHDPAALAARLRRLRAPGRGCGFAPRP